MRDIVGGLRCACSDVTRVAAALARQHTTTQTMMRDFVVRYLFAEHFFVLVSAFASSGRDLH